MFPWKKQTFAISLKPHLAANLWNLLLEWKRSSQHNLTKGAINLSNFGSASFWANSCYLVAWRKSPLWVRALLHHQSQQYPRWNWILDMTSRKGVSFVNTQCFQKYDPIGWYYSKRAGKVSAWWINSVFKNVITCVNAMSKNCSPELLVCLNILDATKAVLATYADPIILNFR